MIMIYKSFMYSESNRRETMETHNHNPSTVDNCKFGRVSGVSVRPHGWGMFLEPG